MWKIKHNGTISPDLRRQVAVGFWGSDKNISPAFLPENPDFWNVIERHAAGIGLKKTSDGRYYRKKDAEYACKNLEKWAMAGGYYLAGKYGKEVKEFSIVVVKV